MVVPLERVTTDFIFIFLTHLLSFMRILLLLILALLDVTYCLVVQERSLNRFFCLLNDHLLFLLQK